MSLYIGLMSGTSMDGIDAALVDVETTQLKAGMTIPYEAKTQQLLTEILTSKYVNIAELAQLNTLIGREFARAVNDLMAQVAIPKDQIIAIGSHGQTIAHDATADIPYTVQLGCPHTIVEQTGITVVADFRTRDVVLGGFGAPFAPIYHQILFSNSQSPVAVVNIGGIANVSFLQKGAASTGFDSGPGNCLMDYWIFEHLKKPYDAGGQWASTGVVNELLLETILQDDYFNRPSPKSIGKEYFSPQWLASYLSSTLRAEDVQATLLALTSSTIAKVINDSRTNPHRLLVCGGGAHNQGLLDDLAVRLPDIEVMSTQSVGVNPDYIEAMMFAWFASKAISKTPVDMRAITHAARPTVLGTIYYPS